MSREFVIRNGAIIDNVLNSTSTQNIITISSGGLIEYRTPSQILSDIGAQSSGNYVTLDTTQIITGNKTFNSSIVINEDGGNRDFRVEGDTDQNLLFTDASVDRIGIGTSTPSQKLDIDGSLRVRSISNGIGNFVTKNVDGVLTERTAAQVLSDIGAQGTITNPVTGTGTTNYVSKWSSSSEQTDSQIFDNGTNVGIGTILPTEKLDVNGILRVRSISNGTGNFITKDVNGVLTERTASEVLSDINAVPDSRTISSGTWLTGGGDLSTNRTINLVPTVDTYLNDSQSNPRIFFGATNELSNQVILRSATSGGQFQLRNGAGVLNWAINFGSGILEVGTVPWARLSNVPNFVLETRTLTINGTTLDLSADRTWNVGTVTSVTTNNGLTGTITSTGTLGLTGQALSLHNLSTNGIITRTGVGTVSSRTLTAGTGISITNGDGVNGNPVISNTISNTNFSNANLTFNGNRTHNTNGNDLFISLDGNFSTSTVTNSFFSLEAGELNMGFGSNVTQRFNTSGIRILVSNNDFILTSAQTIFNNGGRDIDFQIKGDVSSGFSENLLYANIGLDKIGIGTKSPIEKLHIVGNLVREDIIINSSDTLTTSNSTPAEITQIETPTGVARFKVAIVAQRRNTYTTWHTQETYLTVTFNGGDPPIIRGESTLYLHRNSTATSVSFVELPSGFISVRVTGDSNLWNWRSDVEIRSHA